LAGKQRVKSLELVPFDDGRFEVFKDGKKVHSKLQTHAFPDENELVQKIL
jgi:selT/selW/selH-like putative selenoprotein